MNVPVVQQQPTIELARVNNPFRRRVEEFEYFAWRPGITVADVVTCRTSGSKSPDQIVEMVPNGTTWEIKESPSRTLMRDPRPPIRVTVAVNGQVIPPERWRFHQLSPGDQVVVIPDVCGGGTGKTILRVILMVAVAAAAAFGGPALAGVLGLTGTAFKVGSAIISGLILMTGALLINALIPGTGSGSDDNLESTAYTWNPTNTSSQGIVIPRWYGLHRVYGNCISSYIEREDDDEYLNALVSVGYGPVYQFGTFRINGQQSKFFDDVTITTRRGLLEQEVISNFTSTKTEYSMDVQLIYNESYTYATETDDFDGIEVDITFPSGLITYDEEEGEYANAYVQIVIQYRLQGAESWTTLSSETVSGKSTSAIRKTYKVSIAEQGTYEIRCTRLTEDHIGSTITSDDSYLTTVRLVYNDKFTYPRQALYAVRALATSQLSSSIELSVDLHGLIVHVYDSATATWSWEWSNNPAWVAWDLLTQPVLSGEGTVASPYALVRYDGIDPDTRLDLAAFSAWADYCDELVSDGMGGTEKRITFNGGFDSDTTLWEALLKVCKIGRAVPIWNGIIISIAVDKPSDPVFLFSVGNIEESSFKETFLALEDRATEVEVNFTNKSNSYERDKLVVMLADSDSNQYRATIDMFGAVNRSEIWRAGMYHLNSNKYLTRTVEIDVDIEALPATIGDVGYLQHDIPLWSEGGRIVAATLWTVTLDKKVTLEAGKTYVVLLRLDDDTLLERTVESSEDISTAIEGTVTKLSLVGASDDGIGGSPLVSVPTGTATWYSTKQTKRLQITLDHTMVDADLTNFPVPIVISDADSPIFTTALANGYDIVVTASDGYTELDYERSVWEPANHLMVLYVRIPTLSASTDTVIYIYYGDSECVADHQNKTGVWDANYKAVYHFEEDPTTGPAYPEGGSTAYDSTSNAQTATVLDVDGSGYYLAAGSRVSSPIGRGWQLDGNRAMLWNTDVFGGETAAFTVEGVLCRNGSSSIAGDTWGGHGWFLLNSVNMEVWGILDAVHTDSVTTKTATANAVQYLEHTTSTPEVTSTSTAYTLSDFHHLACSGLRSSLKLTGYVDGASLGSATSAYAWAKYEGGGYKLEMGQVYAYGSLVGILSEFRVSNIERSAAWIKATYKSLTINTGSNPEATPGTSFSYVSADEVDIEEVWGELDAKKYDVYAFGESTVVKKLFRIIGIKKSQDQKCSLTLVNYDERVFEDDDHTPAFDINPQDALEEMQPTEVIFTPSIVTGLDGSTTANLNISFTKSADTDYAGCKIYYKNALTKEYSGLADWSVGSPWVTGPYTTGTTAVIYALSRAATYEIVFLPVDVDGNVLARSRAAVYEVTISTAANSTSEYDAEANDYWVLNADGDYEPRT